jgi:hypothetical protein
MDILTKITCTVFAVWTCRYTYLHEDRRNTTSRGIRYLDSYQPHFSLSYDNSAIFIENQSSIIKAHILVTSLVDS